MTEETNLAFMTECLSKAIQWMSPHLIKQIDVKQTIEIVEQLLDLETKVTPLGALPDEAKLEVMLIEIKSKDFETMEKCLNILNNCVPNTVKDLWELYNQFMNTDFDKAMCFCCKLRSHVDIKHCSRYLHMYGIISGHLHKKVLYRNADIGSQEDLWNDLEHECDKYHTPKHIAEAINYGLHAHADEYGFLLADADSWFNKDGSTFKCNCQETCSEMFMPQRYTLRVPSRSLSIDKSLKENLEPKSCQKYSLSYRENGSKHQSRFNTECDKVQKQAEAESPKEIRKCKTADARYRLDVLYKQDSVKEEGEKKTDTKQHTNKTKGNYSDKNEPSTNIYNFYNKGPVSFGTNVVEMKNTRTGEILSDPTKLPRERIALSVPQPIELCAQQLKFNKPQLPAITYPKDSDISDDNEYETLSSNNDRQTKSKQHDTPKKRDRYESEMVQNTDQNSGHSLTESKYVCAERKTGRGLKRRHLSAPSGY